MATLASLNDVKRALHIPLDDVNDDRDAELRVALDAVEGIFKERLEKLTQSGPQMLTFFDVPEDHALRLPSNDVTVTLLRVYEYPSSYGIPLSPIELGLGHGYDLTDDGQVILRPTLAFSPFEGATAQRRLRYYSRVEVHYIGTGEVPAAVTKGIAYLAAGWHTDELRSMQGLSMEKIGDYQYQLGGVTTPDGTPSFWDRGMLMLKPYLNTQRVEAI